MKTIEIDEELYHYIASQTQQIGESASEILRRLLLPDAVATAEAIVGQVSTPAAVKATTEPKVAAEPAANHQKVFDILSKQDLQAEQSVVGRFLIILSALARAHKGKFALVAEIKGRNRLYFARKQADLLEAGSSTNPKPIPNSEFWVITNSNTTRKKMMLTEAALKLGYSQIEAEQIRDFL
ncbi:replication initiation negative regulator SeqA [Rheinheimera riviphila]|uniref:Negative modulator of initiation of replication n=1 Tax=Rheinheimera riviphila TaxID=1834037 RepID=A0A437QSQ3_9GAMM|nr:replication initiation negative regulator SeqA [Rheinheimera riviphila]RVU37522.1 replication initiation negative regulator SeqA [Rheinheimera riviphila]